MGNITRNRAEFRNKNESGAQSFANELIHLNELHLITYKLILWHQNANK